MEEITSMQISEGDRNGAYGMLQVILLASGRVRTVYAPGCVLAMLAVSELCLPI